MKREHSLRRRLHALSSLAEAIGAMKSLSAHHFRSTRAALPAARDYRNGIDDALSAIGVFQPESSEPVTGILVIAADLGLCGGYNAEMASTAIEQHHLLQARRTYCVGHRPLSALKRAGIEVDRVYAASTSVAGLTERLLGLSEDLIVDYLEGRFSTLEVISARFDGVGKFTPMSTRLLPIELPESNATVTPSDYVTRDHLAAVAVREYLYIRLFQTALDSLAAEHGARLVATEAAGEWLAEKTESARRQLAAIRREAATQEVLDIAAIAKRRRKHTHRRSERH